VSFAPKITPADAQVDWKLPAHVADRQVRACTPDPGAWTELDGVRLKLGPIALNPGSGAPGGGGSVAPPDLAPGELQVGRHEVLVGTGSRPVLLGDVQAPGKRRMTAPEWARGLRSGGPVRFG
jgi:methionyl-tRNA formyltransferase